ncbi:hypothetical protein L3X38_027423 [Prunus dulcis]|uniref:OTU domain-containing protein n=1 Tax=Prunus dulcis TaxID=3755 RepID=A0AAD4YZG5_PRUDU|nr:hypothetical protein L3X38_027423 [Prunus dulcis]
MPINLGLISLANVPDINCNCTMEIDMSNNIWASLTGSKLTWKELELNVKEGNVKSDGNCGFRAIGSLMGFGDKAWHKVRKDLLKELRKESVIYELILNGKERIQHIEYMLDYFEDFPLQDRWMTIPNMGHLIASCYNGILMTWLVHQSLTFFSYETAPLDSIYHREIIYVGFVNHNHWIKVYLEGQHPMPPLMSVD